MIPSVLRLILSPAWQGTLPCHVSACLRTFQRMEPVRTETKLFGKSQTRSTYRQPLSRYVSLWYNRLDWWEGVTSSE